MYGKSVLRCRVVSYISLRHYKKNNTKKLLEFLAEMPKVNTPRISDAQRQRQHISKKSEKYGPSTVYLQVIGSGARGAPNTLYLFTDQKRYLFNCGECTQRLAHEHKVKLSRLEHVFVTSKTWRNIGGLPGLSLTLQDVGVPNITLHGPEGLDELYSATKRFVIMKEMNVTMAKCSPSEDFEDNVMTVKYVLLGPHDSLLGKEMKPAAKKPKLDKSADKEFEEFTRDDTDYYRNDTQNHDSDKTNRTKEKPKVKDNLEKDAVMKKTEKVLQQVQRKSHCSVAYICTLKKRLGTLDLAKCVEFGVKPGPLLGQLKNGQDVVLPDGTLVLSKDVKTPDDPGPVFIVLEVPELSYLKESEFSAHFDNGTNPPENIPRLVVHYTPPHVFNHPTYRAFMAMFGPTTSHLVLNTQNSCLGSEAVHRTQHKLHLLDPDIFPLLRDASVPAVWNAHPPLPNTDSPTRLKGLEELKNKIALAQFQNIINMEGSCKGDGEHSVGHDDDNKLEIIAGRTLTVFHLRPKKSLDRSLEPKLHIQDYIQETMDVDGFVGSLEHFRQQVDSMRYVKGNAKEYPKVVFLGTGSCIPSKTRNTSAIVVQIDENRSILMDCGEGTYGQLVRFYGPKRVDAFLRTLKAIYVSHLHADHHIGLIGVLQARRQAFEDVNTEQVEPVYLLAPGQIVTWLSLYDQQFERIRPDFTLIPNQTLIQDAVNRNNEMTSAVLANIGVQQIRTCFVSHCPNAFGVAVDIDGQHKVTYSGDTIPCDELVKIGEDSTLLIHEATMEDELAEEARIKMHSTTSQAIEAGRRMRAKYTLLTHFSQRYARLPRLNHLILNDNHTVGIAFDNMQITMSDMELLPHMYAPLQLMFAEHCVEMELKAAHRARHRDRPSSPASPATSPAAKCSVQCRRVFAWAAAAACRGTESSPPRTHVRYRESNASRLRQELKGMAITGLVRRPRSDSSSPMKTQPSTPSRTTSKTSNASREHSNRSKVTSNIPSGYVIDSRSKTINTECRGPSRDKVSNGTVNGYGKPLVTSLNKKLTIMRDTPRAVNASNSDKKSPVNRSRSPIKSWRAEHKEVSSPLGTKKPNSITSKLPAKGTAFKDKSPSYLTRPIANQPKPGVCSLMEKAPVPSKPTRTQSPSLNRCSNSSSRQVKSTDDKQDTRGSTSYSKMKTTKLSYQKNCISVKTDTNKESSCMKRSYSDRRDRIRPKEKAEAPKNQSVLLRDVLTELKQPLYKDLPSMGRLGSGICSNRSFKLQLEDIKSSYLLLNQKGQDEKAKANVNQMKTGLALHRYVFSRVTNYSRT